MKRYNIYAEGDPHESSLAVDESKYGDWVKHEDAEPILSLLEECRDQFASGTVLFGAKYDDLMGRINAVLDEK
jgi:hypothetical protein